MKEIRDLARQKVLSIKPYSSARSESDKKKLSIYLDANENPYPPSLFYDFEPSVNLEEAQLNRYPDKRPESLLTFFSQHFCVKKENLLFSRGADEAIDLLVRAFCSEDKDSILVTPPTFAMYEHAAAVQGVSVLEVPLYLDTVTNTFDLDENKLISEAKAKKPKLVFLCSPNNPTGCLLSKEKITAIASALFGISIVVVDEIYIDYSNQSSMSFAVKDFPNLVILRSLSKEYSLAGERFGITIAHSEVIEILNLLLPPYPIPRSTIDIVNKAVLEQGIVQARKNIQKIILEKRRVMKELESCQCVINVFKSDANFCLIQVVDSRKVMGFMEAAGIQLRDRSDSLSSVYGDIQAIRVSIGLTEENNAMLKVMRAICI